jgi:hypothetical protein
MSNMCLFSHHLMPLLYLLTIIFYALYSYNRRLSVLSQMDIISSVLQKHFGFSNLKAFQKEVLDAWFAHGIVFF